MILNRILLVTITLLCIAALVCQCRPTDSRPTKPKNNRDNNGTSVSRNGRSRNANISITHQHGKNGVGKDEGKNNAAGSNGAMSTNHGEGNAPSVENDLRPSNATKNIKNKNAKKNNANKKKGQKKVNKPKAENTCKKPKPFALETKRQEHLKTRIQTHADKLAVPPIALTTNTTRGRSTGAHNWDLANSSLCPWEFVIDRDTNRYPIEVLVVHCKNETTTESRGCGSGSKVLTACEEIFFNLPVLMRSPNGCNENGEQIYEEKMQRIVVGCTCASRE